MSSKKRNGSTIKPGHVLVISPSDSEEREIYFYENPKQFVNTLRERDTANLRKKIEEEVGLETKYQHGHFSEASQTVMQTMADNQSYMRMVSKTIERALGSAYKDTVTIPFHDEQAFVEAMFRFGIAVPVTVN